MQANLYPKSVRDDLGALGGITGPRLIRADDGLLYVIKDEAVTNPPAPTVRASEYLWLSLARFVGLSCAMPEVLRIPATGRLVVGIRDEHSVLSRDQRVCQVALLSGRVLDGAAHLSRIYAFDLFCANWDRHPGNYLVLEQGGQLVVFAIDFSHVVTLPPLALSDPSIVSTNATRRFFPALAGKYGGADQAAAIELIERLETLRPEHIEAILIEIPAEWLSATEKEGVRSWWSDGSCSNRLAQIKQGVRDGSLM